MYSGPQMVLTQMVKKRHKFGWWAATADCILRFQPSTLLLVHGRSFTTRLCMFQRTEVMRVLGVGFVPNKCPQRNPTVAGRISASLVASWRASNTWRTSWIGTNARAGIILTEIDKSSSSWYLCWYQDEGLEPFYTSSAKGDKSSLVFVRLWRSWPLSSWPPSRNPSLLWQTGHLASDLLIPETDVDKLKRFCSAVSCKCSKWLHHMDCVQLKK